MLLPAVVVSNSAVVLEKHNEIIFCHGLHN